MQKTKKQLLGLAGLAIVAVMTAVAIAIPAPDAAAADEGGVQLNVRVGENNTSVNFISPVDGFKTANSNLAVSVNYSQAATVEYTLQLVDANGNPVMDASGNPQIKTFGPYPVEGTGTHQSTIDLKTSGFGFGYYKLTAKATGNSGSKEDTTKFYYGAMIVTNTGTTDAAGDPYFDIEIGENVDKVQIQVFDGDKPLFVNGGNQTPLILSRDQIDATTGKIHVALPFALYGIPSGQYTVVSIAYDDNDADIVTDRQTITYTKGGSTPVDPDDPNKPVDPNTPDTPNTGAILDDLNISRLDYLLTGLIAFGAVAGFAIYLICRRDRR